MATTRRINPAAIHALKEALVLAFWYKKDLRGFLRQASVEASWSLIWTGPTTSEPSWRSSWTVWQQINIGILTNS